VLFMLIDQVLPDGVPEPMRSVVADLGPRPPSGDRADGKSR